MTKQSIAIVAVVEKNDTAGPAPAKARGIRKYCPRGLDSDCQWS
jgi:hypothetical protein